MSEYRVDEPEKENDERERFAKTKSIFVLLSSLANLLLSLSFLLPLYQIDVAWNEKGEATAVGLGALWDCLGQADQGNRIAQGILYPLFGALILVFSFLSFRAHRLLKKDESSADKAYFLSFIGLGICSAFEGLFYFSFNHLILMAIYLLLALFDVFCLFFHFKKLTAY